MPVEEKALSGLSQKALGVLGGSARDGLFTLPVEEKAISRLSYRHRRITRAQPKICFSSYLTRKSNVYTLTVLRKALGDLGGLGGRARDGLSSLPVEEKHSAELPRIARDGLSHLPVEEKSVS